ncbi:hypothetical protein DY78_GL000069 [Lactiplantibacillus fabifermentans DSM 21115]|uniref:Uncharacterized protein n=1 Tax=Lactiplantibacillus fabifermentans DSM 21115 TaxID=1413187 RepID=A0A0R2NRC2_9LACO|nr:hypothetical protein DY78_GL000069 [Lactiplantibacillus fabifermentans DSM 21115]
MTVATTDGDAASGPVVGNSKTKIYHLPGQRNYHINSKYAVQFANEALAKQAGYRPALK